MRIKRANSVDHNYGHGGSGVAMSWWAAVRAVQHVASVSDAVLPEVTAEIAREGLR